MRHGNGYVQFICSKDVGNNRGYQWSKGLSKMVEDKILVFIYIFFDLCNTLYGIIKWLFIYLFILCKLWSIKVYIWNLYVLHLYKDVEIN